VSNTDILKVIPQVHWDIIARVIPGAVFVTLVWATLLDAQQAQSLWTAMTAAWYHWIAFIALSYVVGHVCDPLTYDFTGWAARRHFAKYGLVREKEWRDLNRWFAANARNDPEGAWVDKAQVESRSLANLGALLLLFLLLMVIAVLVRAFWTSQSSGPATILRGAIRQRGLLFIATLAVAGLALFGSYLRQRRRVWGMIALFKDKEK